jgi:hypothetical protein
VRAVKRAEDADFPFYRHVRERPLESGVA